MNSEIHISHFSGFFPEIFWKSGNFPQFAFLHQFLCMGHHFHLISVPEFDFTLWISNSKIFLDFFWKFSWHFLEIWKSSRVCYVWPISMYGASFSLDFSHWIWFCTQKIKLQNFSGLFLEYSMFGQFQCMGHHFHFVLVTEIDFALRIPNFQIVWEFFQIFSGNMGILWNLLFLANFNILGMIPTQF